MKSSKKKNRWNNGFHLNKSRRKDYFDDSIDDEDFKERSTYDRSRSELDDYFQENDPYTARRHNRSEYFTDYIEDTLNE